MKNFIDSNGSIITINRGDTFICPIFINRGSTVQPKRYFLTENDRLYFGLMEPNSYFENSILKKVYDYTDRKSPEGDILLGLFPEDTEFLKPGTYYYSIKLRKLDEFGHEIVTTVIPKTLFYII